jgi:uncharacterized protein (TIRG00374 family)
MLDTSRACYLRVLVTAGLIALLIHHLDLKTLFSVLSSVETRFLILAFFTQIILMLVAVLRWKTILANFHIECGYHSLLRLTWIGNFFSQFLPSTIGGDVVKTYYLAKEKNVSMATTLTTTVLERSGGLGALLLIGFTAAWLENISFHGVPCLYIFATLGLIYVLANLALFNHRLHRLLSKVLGRFQARHLAAKLELVWGGLQRLSHNTRAILLVLFLSVFIQLMALLIVGLSSKALGLEIPLSIFLVLVPLINLSIMVPLTINGFGLRESLYLLLFSQMGLSKETAVALSLVSICVVMATTLPGALLYALYRKRGSPKTLAHQENQGL